MSAAILGVSIYSLSNLMGSARYSMQTSRSMITATALAEERAEMLVGSLDLPTNCVGPFSCRDNLQEWAVELGTDGAYQCTQYVDEGMAADPSERGVDTFRYRIDTVVTPHPDPFQGTGTQLVTVSVCWQGDVDRVHMVREQRVVYNP